LKESANTAGKKGLTLPGYGLKRGSTVRVSAESR
jgi:hypothetical protein